MSTSTLPVLWFVFFLLWLNALPPLISVLCGERWGQPLDGGRLWRDQQPIFGPHKTIRGLIASLLGGTLAAPLIGLSWWMGGAACAPPCNMLPYTAVNSLLTRKTIYDKVHIRIGYYSLLKGNSLSSPE